MEIQLHEKFRLLAQLHRSVVQEYLKTFDLYIGQPRLLFTLEDNPGITQNELSKELDVAKESICVSINRLEASGLINREACENDKRVRRLFLTDKGRATVLECRHGFKEINSCMFDNLNDEERVIMDGYFDRMIDRLREKVDHEKTV